jgi:hypothetical protein
MGINFPELFLGSAIGFAIAHAYYAFAKADAEEAAARMMSHLQLQLDVLRTLAGIAERKGIARFVRNAAGEIVGGEIGELKGDVEMRFSVSGTLHDATPGAGAVRGAR